MGLVGRGIILLLLFSGVGAFVADGKAGWAALFGVLFGCALENIRAYLRSP